jgi:hypothetical protein
LILIFPMDPDSPVASRLDSVHYPLANFAGASIALLTLALPIGLVVRYSALPSPEPTVPLVMQPHADKNDKGI